LGLAAFALVPIACCSGVLLLAAPGASVAVAAWIGGIAVGVIALAAIVVALAARGRRRRNARSPSLRITRSRS
jgi:Cu/Ag efflux pump CusA